MDFGEGLDGVAEFFVFIEVAGEGDLVADFGLGVVDPGVGGVGDDFALEVCLDILAERDLLGIAKVRVWLRVTFHIDADVCGGVLCAKLGNNLA